MASFARTLAVLLLLPVAIGTALADEHRQHRGRHAGPEWHGEIGRFHEHDADLWRGGRWHHGRHEGRHGWWWIVGGAWYFYPTRIAPYPDPYLPPVVVAPPPPQQFWYYCANPVGYYPYVARCAVAWQQMPAIASPR